MYFHFLWQSFLNIGNLWDLTVEETPGVTMFQKHPDYTALFLGVHCILWSIRKHTGHHKRASDMSVQWGRECRRWETVPRPLSEIGEHREIRQPTEIWYSSLSVLVRSWEQCGETLAAPSPVILASLGKKGDRCCFKKENEKKLRGKSK